MKDNLDDRFEYRFGEQGNMWPINVLPYDYARCAGFEDNPVCVDCRRREPGRSVYQSYLVPEDAPVDKCGSKINPEGTK